jgi:hypothetical protein
MSGLAGASDLSHSDASRRPTELDVRRLIELALAGLGRMRLDDGTFCLERTAGDSRPVGRSLRYSLMCLIGLMAAARAGHDHDLAGPELRDALRAAEDSPELKAGDLGLYLWADALLDDGANCGRLRDNLVRRLETSGGLAAREGLELAWIVHGLGLSAGADDSLFRQALDTLLGNQRPSGLFTHYGDGRRRSRFPNFATEIYSVLALATVAKLGLDDRAAAAARRAADRLLLLQLPDGGWPWLYDAATGRVVEPYEIYSVHQHAMGPMGMLALAEATADSRYVDATAHGLQWIYGRNELGRSMIDEQRLVIYRSIRRKGASARIVSATNVATATATRHAWVPKAGPVQLNDTCRPYELGWLLEAWCGREAVLDAR